MFLPHQLLVPNFATSGAPVGKINMASVQTDTFLLQVAGIG